MGQVGEGAAVGRAARLECLSSTRTIKETGRAHEFSCVSRLPGSNYAKMCRMAHLPERDIPYYSSR